MMEVCSSNRSLEQLPVIDSINQYPLTDKLYATEGEPLEIHCPAVGYPKPAITWYKGDELIGEWRLRYYWNTECHGLLPYPGDAIQDKG